MTRNPTRNPGEIVRETIEKDPVVRNGLVRGLVNVRALARYIQTISPEDVTFEALVAAIRRYPMNEVEKSRVSMGRFIAKLGLKNEIVEVAIRNEPDIGAILAKFSGEVDHSRGETFSMVTGVRDVVVLVDNSNLDKLLKMVPKKNVISVARDLAVVTVFLPTEMISEEKEARNTELAETPGFLAAMCNEIAMDRIGVWDLLESFSDVTFVVKKGNALRTYRALERIANAK